MWIIRNEFWSQEKLRKELTLSDIALEIVDDGIVKAIPNMVPSIPGIAFELPTYSFFHINAYGNIVLANYPT